MSFKEIVPIAMQASVFLTVLTVGMETSAAALRSLFGQPSRLVGALLAMNVFGPIVAVLICSMFSLHPAVIVGLVALSVAPVASLFPRKVLPLVGPDHVAYAHGLFFASAVLSVVLTPLAVEVMKLFFGRDIQVTPLAVARVVVASMLLPLGIGLAVGRWRPAAARWIPAIRRGGSLVLLAGVLLLVVAAWPQFVLVVRQRTLLAIAIIALIGLAAGHLLGGPDEDDRTILATATVSRHPGVAIAVASLTAQPLAPVGVLMAILVSAVAVRPYLSWRKRRLRPVVPPIVPPVVPPATT